MFVMFEYKVYFGMETNSDPKLYFCLFMGF